MANSPKALVVGCLATTTAALTFTNRAFNDLSPGKSVNITWENANGPVTLTLFQGGTAIDTFLKNAGVIASKQAKLVICESLQIRYAYQQQVMSRTTTISGPRILHLLAMSIQSASRIHLRFQFTAFSSSSSLPSSQLQQPPSLQLQRAMLAQFGRTQPTWDAMEFVPR